MVLLEIPGSSGDYLHLAGRPFGRKHFGGAGQVAGAELIRKRWITCKTSIGGLMGLVAPPKLES